MLGLVTADFSVEFAPWDGRRVPVTLLGGYLGAGKTTVINELLARTDRPLAVLVNDVGAVNVDAALIRRRHGDTIELTDGCVCCSLSRGLADAFDELRRRETPPDHVVLEMSGIADPARVAPWADSTGFRLDSTVVLVDADQFMSQVENPVLAPLIEAQVKAADLLLLTKTDLADPPNVDATRARVSTINADVPVLDPGGPGPSAALVHTGTRRPAGFTALADPSLFDVHHVRTINLDDPISLDGLHEVLDSLPSQVLRAKAVIRSTDDELYMVQVVGSRRAVTPMPRAETQNTTDLVVVEVRTEVDTH